MTRIAITRAAFNTIVATMPLGSVGFEPERDQWGQCVLWIEKLWADKLTAMRRAGETLSDVIVRVAADDFAALR